MRKLTLSLAVMAALLPLRGYSLGLGDLELHSALNQELNAEIEVLSATSEDAEKILIKLADRDAFNRAGLDRPFLLQQLKFRMIDKNGVPHVKVYTQVPVSEPFLSFLLEIDWPQGHLLREYTLLLDPPVYNSNTSGGVASGNSSPFNEPADAQAQTQPVFSQQQNAQSVQGSAQAAPNVQTGVISSGSGRSVNYQYQSLPAASPSVDQYRVQQNDTLWGIANRMRPDSSVSVEQMMLALVRKNPEAFIRENTNGVKRGYILRMPERDEMTRLDRQQAVAQAREHAALWREYSQSATSSSPASAMQMDDMSGDVATDQQRDADGHLSIVGTGDGGEQTGSNQDPNSQLSKLKQELAMANEQLESERLEKEDLQARLAELEQRVKSVIEGGSGVELNDSELASLQEDLKSTQQAAAETVDEPSDSIATDEMADTSAANDDMSAEMADEALSDEDMANEEMPEDAMLSESAADAADLAAEDSVFVDETTTDDMAEDLATDISASDATPLKAVETPAFAQQQPKSFPESLMDDPKLLGMIGGGIAFILLLIALLLKRIRGNKLEEDEWTAGLEDPSLDSGADSATDFSAISGAELNDATQESSAVDMNQTAEMSVAVEDDDITRIKVPDAAEGEEDTVFNLSAAESEVAGLEPDDEKDDVLAEADVYLAYGIYQQAEELLNTAIDQNPDRDDYRMKLLETHYAAKNASAFEELAIDVQSRKGDDKTYWDRVVAMGMELSPTHSLFSAGGAVIGDFDAEALLPDKPQKTDLELDAGDDFDLGLDSDADELELDNTELDLDDEGMDLSGLDDTQIKDEPENLDAVAEMDLAGDLESISSDLDSGDDTSDAESTSSDLEFDLGEIDGLDDAGEDTTEMDIDDDFSLDFDAADLGFEETEAEAEDVSLDADSEADDESVEIDLSEDIGGSDELDAGDLDLGDMDALDDTGTDDSEGEFDISELSEDVDEVGTKLDLAKAYIDMGDKDGAISILEEVKAEGNNEQQQQAEELIQQAS